MLSSDVMFAALGGGLVCETIEVGASQYRVAGKAAPGPNLSERLS